MLDSEVLFLDDPYLLQGYVYERVLYHIISQVRSHFMIHAGVISHNDRGIILTAGSGHGKTTLVLELVRQGFKFLSDEIAALGRVDRLVHPFPRSLRLRLDTLQLVGFQEAFAGAHMWLGKLLLDIEDIQPMSRGESVRVSHIVILQDPMKKEKLRNS